MGERAKIILNEYSAKDLLKRDTLNLDKFYTADLKLFVEVARKEMKSLNNIINELNNANEYHQNIIHELETMKQPNQLHSENVKLRAENNRLNNIIDELENYMIGKDIYKILLYKLRDLKESDKE